MLRDYFKRLLLVVIFALFVMPVFAVTPEEECKNVPEDLTCTPCGECVVVYGRLGLDSAICKKCSEVQCDTIDCKECPEFPACAQ